MAGALVAVLAANVVWFLRPSTDAVPAFKLKLTQAAVDRAEPFRGKMPVFGPGESWQVDGRPVTSVAPFLIDFDPEGIGPDSPGKFILIQLPQGADAETTRKALLALASEGICQLSALTPDMRQGLIYRILAVRDDAGVATRCRDRFNRWADRP